MVSKIKKKNLVAQNTRIIWKFDSLKKKKNDQLYGPPYTTKLKYVNILIFLLHLPFLVI
jgi:hypothetical protein